MVSMERKPLRPNMTLALLGFMAVFGIMLAFVYSVQKADKSSYWSVSGKETQVVAQAASARKQIPYVPTRAPGDPILTPTPDAAHAQPAVRSQAEQYVIQSGDTLGIIARRYGVSIQQLVEANHLPNPDIVSVGQMLEIPAENPRDSTSGFKIIPDSELVYGPYSANFDIEAFVQQKNGQLADYQEMVGGAMLNGAQIVKQVAEDFSVNPRLLLAVLEYQTGWVTRRVQPAMNTQLPGSPSGMLDYPLMQDPLRVGLYSQLSFAANELNRGYYLWRVKGISTWTLADGQVVPVDPAINAGTAGVQQLMATMSDYPGWLKAVSSEGVFTVFNSLFYYPFDYAVEPLVPADLVQPEMQLPFESGTSWVFTGGPHGGWGDASAWAALDFAPSGIAMGCTPSQEWVTAVADGVIIRTGDGTVFQDINDKNGLELDRLEQTGWVVLYMHIAAEGRIQPGTPVKAGDRIGHPSCEGGVSTGTHMHLARKYNGEWIAADQNLPFNLEGWISSGDGMEYDGLLQKNGQVIRADASISPDNVIQR